MIKTFYVALREFVSTVGTKGFILGLILPPILGGFAIVVMPLLLKGTAPKVEGQIAIIDRSGLVAEGFKKRMTPEAVSAYMSRMFNDDEKKKRGVDMPAGSADAAKQLMGTAAVTIQVLPGDTDPDQAKAEILKASDGGKSGGPDQRLAIVVIPAEAVKREDGQALAGIQMLHAPQLALQWIGMIENAAGKAVVDARLEAAGQDAAGIRRLVEMPWSETKSVTKEGDVKTNEMAKILLPGAFMFLMWISIFTSGQYLLTSTIEEKSSRVMEVLLSAVSPMQLLVGKILGQACVGLAIMAVYSSVGVIALIKAAMSNMIDPMLIVYLFVYFLIGFSCIACMFAAVGSAVSDIREAQSLIGPAMIVLMLPMMLWLPITQNPNATLAQVCSFVPPISPFIMVLRLAGNEPVPVWQIPATIIFGIGTVVVLAWAASKIFRIGVLMYGKPPNFRTLIRWVKMA